MLRSTLSTISQHTTLTEPRNARSMLGFLHLSCLTLPLSSPPLLLLSPTPTIPVRRDLLPGRKDTSRHERQAVAQLAAGRLCSLYMKSPADELTEHSRKPPLECPRNNRPMGFRLGAHALSHENSRGLDLPSTSHNRSIHCTTFGIENSDREKGDKDIFLLSLLSPPRSPATTSRGGGGGGGS